MNKKSLNYFNLVIGTLACVSALFFIIQSILSLTSINGNYEAKANVFLVVAALLLLLAAAGFGFAAVLLIRGFVDKKECSDKLTVFACVYFLFEVLANIINMSFITFNNAPAWVVTIISLIGLVLVNLKFFKKFDKKTELIIDLIAATLGFVLTIVVLVYTTNGVAIAREIFIMLMFITLIAAYICTFVVDNSSTAKVENKEEAKAEEPKQVEAKEEASKADSNEKEEKENN